jgi:serine/threonine protein kinase
MNIYTNCINRTCQERKNPKTSDTCGECGTSILLNQRFRILERIGKSSYAYEVFRAEDAEDNNRIVAIKTLVDSSNKVYKAFFEREKIILKSSNYHYLPKFIEEGKDPTRKEIPYFVMEFIEGENLSQWLEIHHKLSNEGKTWDWLASITKTLAYLHDRDRLHLDLKPDNIILKKNSHPDELVLIDFSTDGRVGTPGYIAPERESAQKRNLEQHTPMADFFSLGQTFVHLTTESHPERFRDGGNWAASTSFPSSPIIEVINWMREEDPVNRPQTAYQILYAIDILSKPKSDHSPCTHEDVIDLIKNIRNGLKEDEELRSEIQRLTELNRANSNRILQLIRKYNTIIRKTNLLQKIAIMALIGSIVGLISMLCLNDISQKYHNVSQKYDDIKKNNVDSKTRLNQTIDDLKTQNFNLKSELDKTKKIDEFISSGEKFMRIFGENKDEPPKYKDMREKAIRNFAEGERKTNIDEKSVFYKNAFEDFQRYYAYFGASIKDPQISIYLNNSKVRYLQSLPKNRSKQIYTIAVVSPAQLETGQHILLGAALSQQQLLNKSSTPGTNKPSDTDIYLEIKIVDDRNSHTDKKIAEKLANDKNIFAVVGPYSTEAIELTLDTYANAKEPLAVVSPTATKYGLTKDYDGEDKTYNKNVFFRIISSTKIEATAWVKLIKGLPLLNNKPHSIIVFYEKSQYDKSFSKNIFGRFQELTKDTNLHVPEDKAHTFDLSTNNKKELEEFTKQIGDDSIILLIPNGKSDESDRTYENALTVLSTLKPSQVKRIIASNPLYTIDDVTVSDVETGSDVRKNKLGTWVKRLNIAVDWHYKCNGTEDIDRKLQSFIGGASDRRTVASYEAVEVLSSLFKEQRNIKVTRSSILKGLKELKNHPIRSNATLITVAGSNGMSETVGISISFEDNGDRRQVTERIMVQPVKTMIQNKDKKDIETITFEPIEPNCPRNQVR